MNTLDIVLALILIIAFFVGFSRGFLLSLASLVGVIVGVYGAFYFSDYVARPLTSWFHMSAETTHLIAFIITFFLIALIFSIIGNLLTKVADFAMLGIFNKILGAVFNVLKYAFILSVLFMFLNNSNYQNQFIEDNKAGSALYIPIAVIVPLVLPQILEEIESWETEREDSSPEVILEEN